MLLVDFYKNEKIEWYPRTTPFIVMCIVYCSWSIVYTSQISAKNFCVNVEDVKNNLSPCGQWKQHADETFQKDKFADL